MLNTRLSRSLCSPISSFPLVQRKFSTIVFFNINLFSPKSKITFFSPLYSTIWLSFFSEFHINFSLCSLMKTFSFPQFQNDLFSYYILQRRSALFLRNANWSVSHHCALYSKFFLLKFNAIFPHHKVILLYKLISSKSNISSFHHCTLRYKSLLFLKFSMNFPSLCSPIRFSSPPKIQYKLSTSDFSNAKISSFSSRPILFVQSPYLTRFFPPQMFPFPKVQTSTTCVFTTVLLYHPPKSLPPNNKPIPCKFTNHARLISLKVRHLGKYGWKITSIVGYTILTC